MTTIVARRLAIGLIIVLVLGVMGTIRHRAATDAGGDNTERFVAAAKAKEAKLAVGAAKEDARANAAANVAYAARFERAIADRKVKLGMSAAQCQAAWGKPARVHTTVTANGRRQQWAYNSGSYLYLEDGILTSASN